MADNNLNKDRVIIVAEQDEDSANQITKALAEKGFRDIRIAEDGQKVYDILRPYYNRPEQIGLIIINEFLPSSQVRDMCKSLSCTIDGSIIPFIIICKQRRDPGYFFNQDGCERQNQCLVYTQTCPLDFHELTVAVEFQLAMKNERLLRYKQEERLVMELAERKVVDSKLQYLIAHDELTGLYNRSTFEKKLKLSLTRNRNLNQNSALMFIDIDRFSVITELEGYEIGDRLLVELVVLIRKFATAENLFARIGSDEFCLFLENCNETQALKFAEQIKKVVEDFRFFTGEVCYSISISIGICTVNSATQIYHPAELILHARQACNTAKASGRNRWWLYNDNDTAVIERRHDIFWVPLIKKALVDKELFLVFQPIVKLCDGEVSHYEALIRMKGEDGLIIPPQQFIPVAERMGLIHNIDMWVVESAIEFLAGLSSSLTNISLSVNLSSSAFRDATLLSTIRDKLELTWVDANRLTFEITETAAVENFENARDMIDKIRALGCKFALDDFGTGFCSFNYLKKFPVDFVKIDGQFIQNLISDETDQVLVKSMAEIAARLGKKTIAEFVETPTTIDKLKEFGIDFGQGFIFGKPETNLLQSRRISLINLLRSNKAANPIVSN